MFTFTLVSRDGDIEVFEFTNVDLERNKRGTINRATGEVTLEELDLYAPAQDFKLRAVMHQNDNMNVGDTRYKAYM